MIEGSTPPDNGALIIKNSWGLTTFDGDIDDGYLYLSYYDHSLLAALSYVFDNNNKAKHTTEYRSVRSDDDDMVRYLGL